MVVLICRWIGAPALVRITRPSHPTHLTLAHHAIAHPTHIPTHTPTQPISPLPQKSAFISQLQSLESFLSTHDGPFLGGDMMRQTDCRLAPQLYHSIVALKEFRGFDVLSQFPLLTEYFQAVRGWGEMYGVTHGVMWGMG